MIFSEEEYRGIQDCGRDEGGRFGPRNECQAPDKDGTQATAPTRKSSSWKTSDKKSLSWEGKDSPLKGGENLKSVAFNSPKSISKGISKLLSRGSTIDDLVTIGGGAVRGGEIKIQGGPASGTDVIVQLDAPADPDDDDSWIIETDVTLYYDEDLGGSAVSYGTLDVFRAADYDQPLPAGWTPPDDATVSRITSLMMERMTESMMTAEAKGVKLAETLAIGSPEQGDKFKGYRLWPQFGFDGELPRRAIDLMEQDIESVGLSAEARKKWDDGESVTVQDLIATPQGKRWWNENGSAVDLRLDFRDKKSKGYKQFERMKALLPRLKERNKSRSWFDFDVEFRDVEFRDADCGRDEGGRFGPRNECQAPDKDGTQASTPTRQPPARKAESINIAGREQLPKDIPLDDIVTIGGGDVRGSQIAIAAVSDTYMMDSVVGSGVQISQSIPINPDDPSEGRFGLTVSFSPELKGVEYGSLSQMGGKSPEDLSEESRLRIASILTERMLESMITAEKHGLTKLGMQAAGSSEDSDLKGYRLWPQFGFDAEIPKRIRASIPPALVLQSAGIEVPKPGASRIPHSQVLAGLARQVPELTVQQLISTREGKKWWDENGSDISLSLDLSDKNSLGFKRFEKAKARLPRLKERNKDRDWVDWIEDLEFRAVDCGKDEKGRFEPKNECQEGAGTATEEKPSRPSSSPKPDSWSPGKPHLTPFEAVSASNPTKRSADGKKIESTSIEGAVVTPFAGKDEVDPVSVGRHLLGIQSEHRGRDISTTKPLAGDDFEYMVSGIVSQVEAAQARGVGPNFYSPEDRSAQMEEYAKIQPLMRGGRTASGFCVGVEGPNGECDPGEGISPQAEFLFRAAQALTSPEANPFENMLRADKVLTAFFEEADPEKAKLGLGVRMAGAGGGEAIKNFTRLQKIIDRIGLEETRRLFSEPPMRAGDFERYFLDTIPGTDGDRYKPNDYAVDESVPLFSIFGPKVGPFYANNTGDLDALTADIWFARTWGRLSGELIEKTKPDLAKTHASKLMAMTKHIPRSELAVLGLDGRQFRTIVSDMKKSGAIPQAVISWAEKREKQYQKDNFPSPTKGTGSQERYELDRLAIAVLKNQTRVLKVPTTTVMRSNMIRVMKEASVRTGVPVAYMQDILWQDEQDAWGSLGSRTTTTPGEPSLYSDVIRKIVENPSYRERRREKRSADPVGEPEEYEFLSDQKGGIEQALYAAAVADMDDDEFAELAIALLRRNAERAEESRNFAALDTVEFRDADCGRQDGGKFGPGNQCQEEGGPVQVGPTIQSLSSVEIKSGKQWSKADNITKFSGKDIPTKSLSEASAVVVMDGGLLSQSLSKVGVSLDDAAKVCSSNLPGSTVSISHGNVAEVIEFSQDTSRDREPKPTVTFMSSIPISGIENAATVGVSITNEDGSLFLDYGMLDVSPEAQKASPISIAREMMRSVAGSIGEAEKLGVVSAHMTAARSSDSKNFQGYQIWPRMGFDGVIPRSHVTPLWSVSRGFFSSYGSSLPDKILSPRAREEKKAGKLTIQALYETKEGQEWWQKNGRGMDMSLNIGDEDSPGWQRFVKIRDRVSRRDISDEDVFVEMGVEFRDCGRDEGGKFGPKNYCAADDGGANVTGGGGTATATPQQDRDDSWKQERGDYSWENTGDGPPPVTGGSVLNKLEIADARILRGTMSMFPALKSLDNLAILSGGLARGGEIHIQPWQESIAVASSLPIDPDDEAKGRVYSVVNIEEGSRGLVVHYEEFSPDPAGRTGGADTRRVVSMMMQQMTESLSKAEEIGAVAETFAAGSSGGGEKRLRGYRLWPQFGFDGEIPDHIQGRLTEAAPPWASELISKSKSGKRITVQELIATREGDLWWNENGEDTHMTLDFSNKKSLGYKRFEKMKSRLGRLKDRNQSRSLCEWFGDLEDRSADCGRDEGGKFGPGNQCQEEGGGTATAPSLGSTNDNQSFKGSDAPFRGAERFDSVRVSGGTRVSENLKSMGIDPGDAVDIATGGQPGRSVFIRPAPEHYDKGEGATLFQFERDIGGVEGGMFGSSVIADAGTPGSPELHVYHSVVEVDDSIREDDSKRHAAAREFFKIMTSSIEDSIRLGVKKVSLNAAGSAQKANGFRGYTIWPRMGFDAPIPYNLRQKLPESLSHAKSLLDLHATPEGARWWRDNGTDIDVSFDLTDTSSPQFKILEKFRRKFATEKRDMPLGSGDGWLSPADLAALDEMWEEIWEDGDLDEYEWVERRSADCGTGAGGFKDGNTCAAGESAGSGKSLSQAATQIKSIASKGASREKLQAAIEKAIVGKSGWLGGYTPGESSPSEVCRALGIKVANEDSLDSLMEKSWDFERRGVACAIAQLAAAQKTDPAGLKGATVRIETAKSAGKRFGVSAAEFDGALGAYIGATDEVILVAGSDYGDPNFLKELHESGYDSTPDDAHTVIHEIAHRGHYQEIQRLTGIKRPPEGSSVRQWEAYSARAELESSKSLLREFERDPQWANRVMDKIERVSFYATTEPFEAVAEYTTAVRLGYLVNDKDLDRFCRASLAPTPRRAQR